MLIPAEAYKAAGKIGKYQRVAIGGGEIAIGSGLDWLPSRRGAVQREEMILHQIRFGGVKIAMVDKDIAVQSERHAQI
jgi:hypothetical protein